MSTLKKKAFRYTKEQKAWLKDLENTRTKQGQGSLHRITEEGHKYCCLGRACVVLRKEGYAIKKIVDKGFGEVEYDGDENNLTKSVRSILGLRAKGQTECVIMNDGDTFVGKLPISFKEIAAKIKENPRKFFYKGK